MATDYVQTNASEDLPNNSTIARHPNSVGDEFVAEIPRLLSSEVLTSLSRLEPFISIGHIALEWSMVLAAIAISQRFGHPLLYVLTVAWIGARQHALGILMHEGAHGRLLRDRKCNDLLSDILLAWPIFIATDTYRLNHFPHHRHVNTALDPDLLRKQTEDWKFPKSWGALVMILVKDVLGLQTLEQLSMFVTLSKRIARTTSTAKGGSRLYLLVKIVYYGLVAILITHYELWELFVLYWIVPLLTWLKLILRIRSIAEHFGTANHNIYSVSRSTRLNVLERLFIAPKNINYHLEHHLYPGVPFYRLPKLHQVLMAAPGFRSNAHITHGYVNVLRECVNCRGDERSQKENAQTLPQAFKSKQKTFAGWQVQSCRNFADNSHKRGMDNGYRDAYRANRDRSRSDLPV